MTVDKSDRVALLRVVDALVEDILNTPDQDIMSEAAQDHADPAAVAAQTRSLFDKAAALAGRSRLAAAKKALAARVPAGSGTRLDPAAARHRLEGILGSKPGTAGRLTLAARNGQGLSDADVNSMLDDLAELGISPEPDEP